MEELRKKKMKGKAVQLEEETISEDTTAKDLALHDEKVEKIVTEEEACEFLKLIKQSEYSVVEQLKKLPARISLLSLLLNSEAH